MLSILCAQSKDEAISVLKTALQQKGLGTEGDSHPTPDSNKLVQVMEERLREREELISSKGQTIEVLQKELAEKEQQCHDLVEENKKAKEALEELVQLKEEFNKTQHELAQVLEKHKLELSEKNAMLQNQDKELQALRESQVGTWFHLGY